MNTLRLEVPVTCGCQNCGGKGTLCSYVDNITMRATNVVINGVTFVQRVYNRYEANGTLYEVTEQPAWNGEGVEYITLNRIVCALQTTETGCIADTPDNLELLVTNCGCFIPTCHKRICELEIKKLPNRHGYWKQDALNSRIIHLEQYKKRNFHPANLLIAYQTDGDYEGLGGEIMIPEFAMKAFFVATTYYRDQWKPNTIVSPREKEFNLQEFRRVKKELVQWMNPIIMEDFARLSEVFPTWGGMRQMNHHDDFRHGWFFDNINAI